jgi:hypothetical protein
LTLLDLFKWAFSRKRKWLEPNKIVSRYRFRGKWSFSFLLLGNLVKRLVDFTVKLNFPIFFAKLRIWFNSLSLFLRLSIFSVGKKCITFPGKVVLRSWYERNKHIFPASRWEPYDPTKIYDKYTYHDRKTKNWKSFQVSSFTIIHLF